MLTLDTKRTSDAELDSFSSYLDVSLRKGVLSSVACLVLFWFGFILFCLVGFVLFCFCLVLVWFSLVLFCFVFPLKECINNLRDRRSIVSLCTGVSLYICYMCTGYIKPFI